jgi:hypothetical protein
MTRARSAQCSATPYLQVCYISLENAVHRTHTQVKNSQLKFQPCRSHVREVRGAGAVDLHSQIVFFDSLSVLPLAKVRVSLQYERFVLRETEADAMIRTSLLVLFCLLIPSLYALCALGGPCFHQFLLVGSLTGTRVPCLDWLMAAFGSHC